MNFYRYRSQACQIFLRVIIDDIDKIHPRILHKKHTAERILLVIIGRYAINTSESDEMLQRHLLSIFKDT